MFNKPFVFHINIRDLHNGLFYINKNLRKDKNIQKKKIFKEKKENRN